MSSYFQHILITGASSGIGAALASHYAAPKITLSLCARNAERLDEIAQHCREKGAVVESKILDVGVSPTLEEWIGARDTALPIDCLIANAGISVSSRNQTQPFDSARAKTEDALIATNIQGVIHCVRAIVPLMQARKTGHIALVSSIAGFRGQPGAPLYSASKAFVRTYGEALYGRLHAANVAVSIICPGFVQSRITDVNTFKMPFFMSADKAALRIAKGIAKQKLMIIFPWQMRIIAYFLSWLPAKFLMQHLAKLPQK